MEKEDIHPAILLGHIIRGVKKKQQNKLELERKRRENAIANAKENAVINAEQTQTQTQRKRNYKRPAHYADGWYGTIWCAKMTRVKVPRLGKSRLSERRGLVCSGRAHSLGQGTSSTFVSFLANLKLEKSIMLK